MKTVQELKSNINKLRREISDFELEEVSNAEKLAGIELGLEKQAAQLRLTDLYKRDGKEFPSDHIYRAQNTRTNLKKTIDFERSV